MTDEALRTRLDKAWTRQERELGLRVPVAVRRYAEENLSGGIDDAEDLEGFADAIPDYLVLIALYLKEASPTPQARGPQKRSAHTPHATYGKPFDRRVRILGFVAERSVDLPDLLRCNLNATPRQIRWKDMCATWNAAHPHDHMAPATLKREYYRARGQAPTRDAWFQANTARLYEMVDLFESAVQKFRDVPPALENLQEQTARLLSKAVGRPEWGPFARRLRRDLKTTFPRMVRDLRGKLHSWEDYLTRVKAASGRLRRRTRSSEPPRTLGKRAP